MEFNQTNRNAGDVNNAVGRPHDPFCCEECGSTDVTVTMQLRKNGKVWFSVHCESHHGWSHFLHRGPREAAVERWLKAAREAAGVPG